MTDAKRDNLAPVDSAGDGGAPDRVIRESYRESRRVARKASSSFYWTFRLLPPDQRRAMCALYAFSRYTDDLGDSIRPADERRRQLEAWRAEVLAVLPEGPTAADSIPHPAAPSHATFAPSPGAALSGPGRRILPALADTVRRYEIPREYLLDILHGVMMDVEPRGFETMEELREYCYRVASCVGLACVHIWGFRDEAVRQPAIACGIAFQMTNILRDLREDARRGRVYLPREDLGRFQVRAEDLEHGPFDHRLTRLMRFQIERTERLYVESQATAMFLTAPGRRMFEMMFATYRELLREIKRRDGDVFARRVRLPLRRKAAIAARHLLPWSRGPADPERASWEVTGR